MRILKAIAAAALLAGSGTASVAEDVINAVHFTPTQVGFAQSFLRFVDMVNERGAGVVKINVRGGPEIVPNPQIGVAQQNGLVDMFNAPAGLYLEIVPEGEVFSASTIKPWDARESGAWDYIDKVYQEKGNAKLLAHVDAGAGFWIWTVEEPQFTTEGMLDFSKLVIRSAPLYKQFFESLGAQIVVQPAGDVYTSLERGVINANAYPSIGYKAFGWDKFTRYRVEPSFFNLDVLITMNLDAWNGLSEESRAILNEVAIEYERASYDAIAQEDVDERAKMEAEGMEVREMTGEGRAKFLEGAARASWDRMEARDPTHIEELRKLFP